MQFEMKILAHLSRVYPDQGGWMLHDGLDEKEPVWGLMVLPNFNQLHDDLDYRYHWVPNL